MTRNLSLRSPANWTLASGPTDRTSPGFGSGVRSSRLAATRLRRIRHPPAVRTPPRLHLERPQPGAEAKQRRSEHRTDPKHQRAPLQRMVISNGQASSSATGSPPFASHRARISARIRRAPGSPCSAFRSSKLHRSVRATSAASSVFALTGRAGVTDTRTTRLGIAVVHQDHKPAGTR